MERSIIQDLKRWQNKPNRKPLLLTGVRQCGKTYIIEKFAKENFENYLYVNFESANAVSGIFDYDFDVKRIISELERNYKTTVIPGKTLVFF